MTKYQESLVLQNMDYAAKLANGYAKNREWYDDLRAEAWLALSLCAVKYNPSNYNDVCFVTFCTPYIKGKLAQYVMREYRGAYLDKYERKLATMLSIDKPMDDEDDSYTLGETLASSSYDDWQRDENILEVLGQILPMLNKKELDVFNAKFSSMGGNDAVIKLAHKRKVSVGLINEEAHSLYLKMCDIAESKGLTF